MKVAIIIVNYNDVENTIKYVNSISNYDVLDRILVVDNLSTNPNTMDELEKIKSDKVMVISSDKNGGYDYGNNYGYKYLQSLDEKYDYIIVSNPDIEVEEKAIKHSIDVLENDPKVAVCAPRMFNKDNNPIRRSSWKVRTFLLDTIHATRVLEIIFYKMLRNGEYSAKEYEQECLEVEAISGAFFIIKSSVFEEVGMLDENVFLFYEEDILAHQLKNAGYKTISLNTEKFIHYESQTIGKSFSYYKKMKQLFKSKMYYHKTYNKINSVQCFIYYVLNVLRKIELCVEIPVRKILHK